jgi:hypothetical protein
MQGSVCCAHPATSDLSTPCVVNLLKIRVLSLYTGDSTWCDVTSPIKIGCEDKHCFKKLETPLEIQQ